MTRYEKELRTAVHAAETAASIYHNVSTAGTEIKDNTIGAYDVVTDNDVKAEKAILDVISKEFPDDSFLCEESGDIGKSDRVWAVDPIDGTVNYARGATAYGTQISLNEGDETLVSVILVPYDNITIYAEKGQGAFINGKRISIAECRPMKECILSSSDYTKRDKVFRSQHIELIDIICRKVARIRMYGCACYDFAMLVSGCIDYHMRFLHHPWDHLPGMLISKEAGAVYDEDLFKKREFLMLARSDDNLSEITDAIDDEMHWLT